MATDKRNHRRENAKTTFLAGGKKRGGFVPPHLRVCEDHPDAKLMACHYPDLALLIIKCPDPDCEQPSAEIVENYRRRR